MKTIKHVLSFLVVSLFSSNSMAHENYLGHAPDRGVLISITPDKKAVKAGEKLTFYGSIIVSNKSDDDDDNNKDKKGKSKKDGLLEDFRKQGVDIVATYPSSATDITSKLNIYSNGKNEIKFSFEAPAIFANDLNQFSIKVYNNHQDKELLKRLSAIMAKLERRLLALQDLKRKHEDKKSSKETIEYLQTELDKLSGISLKISQRLNSSEDLMAENTYSIQVDNLISSPSRISTVMNKFRFVIEAEPGTVIEGLSTKIKAQVTNLRRGDDDNDDDSYEKDEFVIADFLFNGSIIYSSKSQKLIGGQQISYDYITKDLVPSNSNFFSIALYHAEKNKKEKRIGYLSQKIPVAEDLISPIWRSDSSPNQVNPYVKTMEAVNLKVSDAFGRIDPDSIKAQITGKTKAGVNFSKNLSAQLAKVKLNEGQSYEFIGDGNPLEEGDYVFAASAQDMAENFADPNPYSVNFRIDRTAPAITIGLPDGKLTNLMNYDVPIQINDLSPAQTSIYVNNELFFSTGAKQFNANIILNLEGTNIVKVISTDAAGNISDPKQITIIRDTTPPVLSNLFPVAGSTLHTLTFNVSGDANEPLSEIDVNGLSLNLSPDGKHYSGNYVTPNLSPLTLTWTAKDIVGNQSQTTIQVEINLALLIPELISVLPDSDGIHLAIIGAAGAARNGAQLNAKADFLGFNSASGVANSDGSFKLVLSPFSSVTLKAIDESSGEEKSITLTYQRSTRLSGTVKDTDGNPLPGATIKISTSTGLALTDGAGVFNIDSPVTGDQSLTIDGSTIPQSVTGPNRKFSQTTIQINIGLGQENILSRPIYLAPLLVDGSETEVVQNQATTVESLQAPGVNIEIPANAVIFPDGNRAGTINIASIDSNRATVPVLESAVPTKVIALEPSGLKFTERVPVTLPNDNDLPADVEMIILSMDSSKGTWEVDGMAKVSSDGQTIETKPGEGISHFSLIYAIPSRPEILAVENPKQSGIDISQGSLTTQIQLPSWKSIGQKIAPSLVYKSNWANPTAYVSNYFDIPRQELTIKKESNQSTSEIKTVTGRYCEKFLGVTIRCYNIYDEYLIQAELKESLTQTSWYQPESIKAQFFVSNLTSGELKFVDSSTTSGSGDVQAQTIPGLVYQSGLATGITSYVGIPNRALLSYAVPLKNPANNEYLASGIYPTLSRFEIRLKNLTIRTYSRVKSSSINGKGINQSNIEITNETSKTAQVLDQVFPRDLSSSILVQNKVLSPAGRGWHLGLSQNILNPDGNRVMVEEMNGEVSTYAVSNSISTVFNSTGTGVDTNSTFNFSNWPKVVGVYKDNSKNNSLVEINLNTSIPTVTNINQIDQYSGRIEYNAFESGECSNPSTTVSNKLYLYKMQTTMTGIVRNSNGDIYGLNQLDHSLFSSQTGVFSRVVSYLDNAFISFANFSGETQSQIDFDCNSLFGATCDQSVATSYSCSSVFCSPKIGGCNPPHDPSNGQFGRANVPRGNISNNFDSSISETGFNSPSSLVISPDGYLIVSDTGNNMVRKVDVSNNRISTIVGNGWNLDTADSGLAVNSSIFHPRGLVYDNAGNLYISSENGYIRKVDPQGNISHFGGLPLSNGGILNDQAPAKQMALYQPNGLAFDNDNQILYVADTGNHRIVKFDISSETASTVAGNGTCNPTQVIDNVPALATSLCSPKYIGLDPDKNLIIVDSGHNRIRKVNFNFSTTGTLAFSSSAKDGSSLFRYQDGTWSRKYRNGNIAYFNSNGQQINMTDRAGRRVSYQYDINKNLSRIIDPSGQITNLNYSGNILNSITDPAGRNTNFIYSGGQLISVNFPDSTSKTFEYNSDGLMTREVNQRGFVKKYSYNQYNRLETVADELNHVTQVNDVVSASMSNNYTGGTVGQLNNQGDSPTQLHDRVIDAKNIETEITKDFNGLILKIKNGKDQLTTIERDIEGLTKLITFSDGSKVSLEYDPSTQDLLKTKDTGTGIETSQTYDSFGNIISRTDGNGFTAIKNYDPNTGLLLSEVAPGSQKVEYAYNSLALPITRTLFPTSNSTIVTRFEFDSRGNRTKLIEPDGKENLYTYDSAGNVIQVTRQITSTLQEITKFEYDSINRLIKVTSPKNEITEYSYFPSGELATIKDPYSNITSFEYDGKGQLLRKIEPDNMIYSFTYDANGNLIAEIDPNGNTKSYTVDELNRITKVQLVDDELNYIYNAKGEVLNASNNFASIMQTLDTKGRLLSTLTSGAGALSSYPQVPINYSYDFNDNRTGLQSNAISLNYFYDNSNRLRQLASSNGDVFNFDFDNANRMNQIQRPGSSTAFTYNSASFLSLIVHGTSSGTIASNQYSYDLRNQPIQKRTIAGDFSYSYDLNGQLTSATNPSSTSESFSYDSIGNRITDQDGSYTYNSSRKRVEQDANFTYTHDSNGNMIGKFPKALGQDKFQYLYTSLNQLKEVRVFDSNNTQKRSVLFTYDPQGRRLSKKLIDIQAPSKSFERFYIYDGSNIIAEYDNAGSLLATHTHSLLAADDILGSQITAEGVSSGLAQNQGKFYYLKDHLRSVDDIINSSGNIIQHYSYSSFGKILSIKDSSGNDISTTPFINTSYSFTGREFDRETGLYFYRARTYDPAIGRFLQVDPDPGKVASPITVVNKFAYVGNNPIIHKDPSGKDFWRDLGIAAVAVGAFFTGAWIGGLAAGALGFAAGSAGAIIAGTLFGAAGGGVFGAIAFPALGLGTSQEGFSLGALSGGLGGLARGAGWMGEYSVSTYKGGNIINGIENGVNSFINSLTSPGSQNATFSLARGTEFANFLNTIEPYAIAVGGGLFSIGTVYECANGQCNIPQTNIINERF